LHDPEGSIPGAIVPAACAWSLKTLYWDSDRLQLTVGSVDDDSRVNR
jgi:hypothetical protein